MPHRAAAAFFAAADRWALVIFAARALPPFSPPFRPRATAAGSFPASAGGAAGFCTSVSPVTFSRMEMADKFGSGSRGAGFLRERFGMVGLSPARRLSRKRNLSPRWRPVEGLGVEQVPVTDDVLAKVREHWRVERCAVCGTHNPNWSLSDRVFCLPELKGMTVNMSRTFPVIPVSCLTCGNTYFLNAIFLGIDPAKVGADPPAPAQQGGPTNG